MLEVFERFSPKVGQKLGGIGDESGLVALTTMRCRRQERTIGLEHKPVKRHTAGSFELTLVFGERHDAIEGNEQATLQRAFELRDTSSETMDQAPYRRTFGTIIIEDAEKIREGIADVKDHRKVEPEAELDLEAKSPLLVLERGLALEVIKAALTDSNYSLQLSEAGDLLEGFIAPIGVVRVEPDGSPKIVIGARYCDGLRRVLLVYPDAENLLDIGGSGPIKDLVELGTELIKMNVGVSID